MKKYYFRQSANYADVEISEEDYNDKKQNLTTHCKVMMLEDDELYCGVNRDGENCLNALVYYDFCKNRLADSPETRARRIIDDYYIFLRKNTRKFVGEVLDVPYVVKNYRLYHIFTFIRADYYVRKMDKKNIAAKYWDVDTNTIFLFLELCDAIAATYIRTHQLRTTMSQDDYMRITGGKTLDDIIADKVGKAGDGEKIIDRTRYAITPRNIM